MRHFAWILPVAALVIAAGSATAHEMPEAPARATEPQAPAEGMTAPSADQPEGEKWLANFSFVTGGQYLLHSTWKENGRDQLSAGEIEADFGMVDWPVNLYIGAGGGSVPDDKMMDRDIFSLSSLKIGARYFGHKQGAARPYLTAGAAFLNTNINDNRGYRSNRNDGATGVFAGVGVKFKLGRYFHLGFDATVAAAGKLENVPNSNYIRLGFVIGAGSI